MARVGKVVLDAAFAVDMELAPGLVESVYRIAMKHVIEGNGVAVETEVKLPILFRGVPLESGRCLDPLVNKSVIVELKLAEKMSPVCEAQLLTYLRLSKVRLGFLINFNVPHWKDGKNGLLSELFGRKGACGQSPKTFESFVPFVFKSTAQEPTLL